MITTKLIFGQECKCVIPFNNNSVKYSIIIKSCDNCAPIRNLGYRVMLMLSDNELKQITHMDKRCWSEWLSSEKTDWAANLLLYYIYSKDAFLLKNKNIYSWRKYLKKDDINYWHKKLSI